MAEWHLTPEYILENVTDEEFAMYWRKRNERVVAADRAVEKLSDQDSAPQYSATASRRVSDVELFKMMGIRPAKA